MKKFLVVIAAALAVMLAAGPRAHAGLLVNTTTTDLTAFGFGTVPPQLTLEATGGETPSGLEQGCSIPPAGSGGSPGKPQGSACGTVSPFNITPEIGSTLGQDSKNTLVTLGDRNLKSFADMANLALLFNTNEANKTLDLTLQTLDLGIFSADGKTLLFDFPLEGALNGPTGPVDLLTIAQGQGAAGFVITIDPTELTAFETALKTFNPDWIVGVAATIGCTLADVNNKLNDNCNKAHQFAVDDGAESFTLQNLAHPVVPEPGTLLLLGGGLIGLLGFRRFRKS